MGLLQPVYTIAVQNAAPRRQMGAATSSTSFFGRLDSRLAVATFARVIVTRYHTNLPTCATSIAGVLIRSGRSMQIRETRRGRRAHLAARRRILHAIVNTGWSRPMPRRHDHAERDVGPCRRVIHIREQNHPAATRIDPATATACTYRSAERLAAGKAAQHGAIISGVSRLPDCVAETRAPLHEQRQVDDHAEHAMPSTNTQTEQMLITGLRNNSSGIIGAGDLIRRTEMRPASASERQQRLDTQGAPAYCVGHVRARAAVRRSDQGRESPPVEAPDHGGGFMLELEVDGVTAIRTDRQIARSTPARDDR